MKIGDYKIADFVYALHLPQTFLPGPSSPTTDPNYAESADPKYWDIFKTDEASQLTVHVYQEPETENLVTAVWAQCADPQAHDNAISIEQDGQRFLIGRSLLARIQPDKASLEILVSDRHDGPAILIATRLALSQLLRQSGGFMLHSSGLVAANRAYLFFGVSGSGKSTMARLAGAETILSDEVVVARPVNGQWMAYGTPFSSKMPGTNATAPLAALIKLTQAPHNRLRRLTGRKALQHLLRSVMIFDDMAENNNQLTGNVLAAIDAVPAYELEFRPVPDVWPLVLREVGAAPLAARLEVH